MKEERLWKRKRALIISPGFQWSIVIKTVLLIVLVSAVFAWFTFYFLWDSTIQQGNLSQILLLHQPGLWIGWGICMLICVLVVALILLRLTHRVAGQIYRFERALDQALKGEHVGSVFTRKDDYFHEFEAGLNRYLNMEN